MNIKHETPPLNDHDDENLSVLNSPPAEPEREIYPESTNRYKGAVLWLGLAFAALVIIVQQFSGYS